MCLSFAMSKYEEHTEKVREFYQTRWKVCLLAWMKGNGRFPKKTKESLHAVMSEIRRGRGFITDEELKHAYKVISNRKTREHLNDESDRNGPERYAFDMISELADREVLYGQWIGNHCVDIIIFYISHNDLIGLIIEVDGSVHYKDQVKILKDDFGDHYLSFFFGLERYRIETHNVYDDKTYTRIQKILRGDKPQFKSVQNLRRKIWFHTVGMHATKEDYQTFFGISPDGYDQLEKFYYANCGPGITIPFFERRLARRFPRIILDVEGRVGGSTPARADRPEEQLQYQEQPKRRGRPARTPGDKTTPVKPAASPRLVKRRKH